jgi:predicted MFS family arabinose efflux permease
VLQELNPDAGRTTGVISLTSLVWLTLGAFAIGTEGFMIAGLLLTLARDLNVGLPAAGHLVTAFSLAYAIGAPIMAVLTAGLERRRLLAVAMGGFTLSNLLAALAGRSRPFSIAWGHGRWITGQSGAVRLDGEPHRRALRL